ncbi:5-formyltetrahydrofolate cyclo-ligase [Paenibacillus sp. DMB20]|uniref:5-formyltetrahydrofolate cyclo-ligase n=1 Tax=Paenibacillus sp. DMB20 TaxID=1642570 RepID=UPI001364AD72
MAFDRKGGRLGYGGGYYDRLRERLNLQESARGKRSLWIGLAYEIQLMDKVPTESHDLRLDGLITENGCIKFEE